MSEKAEDPKDPKTTAEADKAAAERKQRRGNDTPAGKTFQQTGTEKRG